MNDEKRKVLIVDDNEQAVEMLQIILEEEGYDIISAYVGEIGLKKASEEKPDIVILDIGLPGMDGYQVCEKIKSDPATAEIPVIMLTGIDMVDDFERAMEKKADWYIVKPYNVDHLLRTMEKLIDEK